MLISYFLLWGLKGTLSPDSHTPMSPLWVTGWRVISCTHGGWVFVGNAHVYPCDFDQCRCSHFMRLEYKPHVPGALQWTSDVPKQCHTSEPRARREDEWWWSSKESFMEEVIEAESHLRWLDVCCVHVLVSRERLPQAAGSRACETGRPAGGHVVVRRHQDVVREKQWKEEEEVAVCWGSVVIPRGPSVGLRQEGQHAVER